VEIASQHLLDGQLIEGWFDIKKGNKVSYRTPSGASWNYGVG
jgi:hypothetical protein